MLATRPSDARRPYAATAPPEPDCSTTSRPRPRPARPHNGTTRAVSPKGVDGVGLLLADAPSAPGRRNSPPTESPAQARQLRPWPSDEQPLADLGALLHLAGAGLDHGPKRCLR